MAIAFSPSKSGWYYEVELHMFVKEWSVKSGRHPVSRDGRFYDTSFAKKCEDFGWDFENRPIFREDQFYKGMVLRSLTIYGDVTIAGEGLQNLGLCSALKGGIFIVPHLL
jgi:hypothetical protein